MPLVDIDIKPNRDPTAKIYEPPIDDASEEPHNPDVPAENDGRSPSICQFCKKPYPTPGDFDKHKAEGCPDAVICKYCNNKFPRRDLPVHEQECATYDTCPFCLKEFRLNKLPIH